jgi:hypothetical protein
MKKTQATLLFVALCTGLILAGCQKPAAPTNSTATNAEMKVQDVNQAKTTGSMTIVPPTETKANMAITEAGTAPVVTVTPTVEATDAAAKAAAEAAKTVTP